MPLHKAVRAAASDVAGRRLRLYSDDRHLLRPRDQHRGPDHLYRLGGPVPDIGFQPRLRLLLLSGRSTNRFPVRDIRYPEGFDISLQVTIADQYKTLKEVIVIKKTYRQDSIENRARYQKIFNFEKGISINSGGIAGAGIDPNSLINLFRFRWRKSMTSLQNRLLAEEAEKFVGHRFHKELVKNLTGLEGEDLDHFMLVYRPSYEFTALTTEYQFYQYILDASRLYRKGVLPGPDFWKERF